MLLAKKAALAEVLNIRISQLEICGEVTAGEAVAIYYMR